MNVGSLSIELKFDLNSSSCDLPLRSPAKHIQAVCERDIYYDVAGTFSLLRSGCFMRIRNANVLEFKFDGSHSAVHEYCYETAFQVPLNASESEHLVHSLCRAGLRIPTELSSVQNILVENGLSVLVNVNKARQVFAVGGFTVCRDDVEDLGRYLEIEFCTSELDCDVKAITQRMRELISDPDLPIVRTGYVELLLARQRPELIASGVLPQPR